MNDRITKWLKNHLVNCEYTEFGWQECHRYEFNEEELKEYAKLIVQECIDAVYDDGQDAEYYQNRIKQNFGIKE